MGTGLMMSVYLRFGFHPTSVTVCTQINRSAPCLQLPAEAACLPLYSALPNTVFQQSGAGVNVCLGSWSSNDAADFMYGPLTRKVGHKRVVPSHMSDFRGGIISHTGLTSLLV